VAPLSIGIDFGTTNSAIAYTLPNGTTHLVNFPTANGPSTTSRSVLYAQQHTTRLGRPVSIYTGAPAIEHYLADHEADTTRSRFIQSLKSHLSARTLTGTEIFSRHYQFEALVAKILRDLRLRASEHLGTEVTHALVGRPVSFVGADSEADNDFAVSRLRASLLQAGFLSVDFALEPVAAAYAAQINAAHTSLHSDREELVLIGDFGGGTTDFSLLRTHPTASNRTMQVLGSTGVGLAGDAFDARIVRYLIAPALGSNSFARSVGKVLPALPAWIYANLERWHTLSFLRTREVMEILRTTQKRALEPEKIAALASIVEHDLGYRLHQAVQRLKIALTENDHAQFILDTDTVHLTQPVTRADFEQWIAPDLARMESSLEALLTSTNTTAPQIDRVFLTGGTSLVPAVQQVFTTRFGPDRVHSGGVFTSVAQGLALMAAERQRQT